MSTTMYTASEMATIPSGRYDLPPPPSAAPANMEHCEEDCNNILERLNLFLSVSSSWRRRRSVL